MRPDVATTICLVLKDENTYRGASEEKKEKIQDYPCYSPKLIIVFNHSAVPKRSKS